MDLLIKQYKKGDELKILELFKEVFNKDMDLKYWKWRYDKESNKYINLIWHDARLVGNYSLFPIELVYNKKSIKTGFSMTTMTSNDYKKQGVFTSLAKDLYLNQYGNLKIIWGFPNNNSFHGFIKYLDWKHISDINMLTLDINKIEKKLDINIENISATDIFTTEYDVLFEKVISKYKIMTKRDSNYLNWRYVNNPANQYYILEYRKNGILKGYSIYKMYLFENQVSGDIVDIVSTDEKEFKELIIKTIFEIVNKNGKSANIWMNRRGFKNILYDIGFKESNNITKFGIRINSNEENLDDALNINNWYITMGDSDVF